MTGITKEDDLRVDSDLDRVENPIEFGYGLSPSENKGAQPIS